MQVVPLEEAGEARRGGGRSSENLEIEAFAEHGADPALRLPLVSG